MFKQYDPDLIAMSFRGIPMFGIMSGTFVSAERAEDAFSMDVGAAGDVTRVRSRNRTGTVKFTLKAESPINDLLSAVALEDELFGTGLGTLFIENLNGTTALVAPIAWIQKMPTVEYATEASGREWTIACESLEMFVGGAIV